MSIDRLERGANTKSRPLKVSFASFVKPMGGSTTDGRRPGS